MKHALMIAALVCTSGFVAADENKVTCDDVASMAEAVMKTRQAGVALSAVLRAAGDNSLFRSVVIEAYESPRFQTKQIQEQQVQEFRTRWHLICLQSDTQDGSPS